MKSFLKMTAILVGAGLASVFAARAIQAGRRRLKSALAEAEAVADRSRETVEQVQTLLHDARTAL
jgi:thioredoxin reductase